MTTTERASRRTVLGALAAGATGATAGCLSGGDGGSTTTVDSLPAPVRGDPDADVTVAVFVDYACPHCQTYELEVLPELEAAYIEPGAVRYEHHDFPIPVDGEWSWTAAGAARAVQDAADDQAFFTYSRRLFEHQARYSMDLLGRLAEGVGVDPGRVQHAARRGTYRPVLETDRQRGSELGLDGTPEVFVDGEPTADYAFDTIAAAIEDTSER